MIFRLNMLYPLTPIVSSGTMTAEQEKEPIYENKPTNIGSSSEGNRGQRIERSRAGAGFGSVSPDHFAVSIRRARYTAGDSRQASRNPRSQSTGEVIKNPGLLDTGRGHSQLGLSPRLRRSISIIAEAPNDGKVFAMSNVLSRDRKLMIVRLLVEGNSLRGITRAVGAHRSAVTRVLTEVGDSCRQFLDAQMRNLTLRHVQVDEAWTFVSKKQSRLTVDERQERADIGDMFLWVAFDEDTKLVPTFILGKRSADMARRFMVDLASRLVPPNQPYG
jgi:hypothetical protein